MTQAQLALLQLIAEGNYLPCLHADLTVLAALFRRGYIQYGGYNVTVTEAGKRALDAQKWAHDERG